MSQKLLESAKGLVTNCQVNLLKVVKFCQKLSFLIWLKEAYKSYTIY